MDKSHSPVFISAKFCDVQPDAIVAPFSSPVTPDTLARCNAAGRLTYYSTCRASQLTNGWCICDETALLSRAAEAMPPIDLIEIRASELEVGDEIMEFKHESYIVWKPWSQDLRIVKFVYADRCIVSPFGSTIGWMVRIRRRAAINSTVAVASPVVLPHIDDTRLATLYGSQHGETFGSRNVSDDVREAWSRVLRTKVIASDAERRAREPQVLVQPMFEEWE